MIGNTFKKKKVMSLIFLVVFDFSKSLANSRGRKKVTKTQQNSFVLLKGEVINKHFHLEDKSVSMLRFVYMGTS